MGFNTSSVWMKVTFICLCLATLLFVIGFATTVWMTFSGTYYSRHRIDEDDWGLWNRAVCAHGECQDTKLNSRTLGSYKAWYIATQAFMCIGLIFLCVSLLICFLYLFVDSMRRRTPLIALIICTFVAVGAMVIGFLVFGFKFEKDIFDIGWSMGVAIAGCILAFVAGVMAVIDLKK